MKYDIYKPHSAYTAVCSWNLHSLLKKS